MRFEMRRAFAPVLAACALSFALCASAQTIPANVQQGLTWLQGRVQADGSVAGEAGSIAVAQQVRSETLSTLSTLATPPAVLATAVRTDPSTHVEALARRIISLKAAGDPVTTYASELIGQKRADGGWGYTSAFDSNALDTAFALA